MNLEILSLQNYLTIDILYIVNYRRGHSLKFAKKKKKKKKKKRRVFFCDRRSSSRKRYLCMHILTNSAILIISNHKSMFDVRIAKIHSTVINFAVYLIRLLKQEMRLRMLGP